MRAGVWMLGAIFGVLAQIANAGSGSHGGGGIYCPKEPDPALQYQLLDLLEVTQRGQKVLRSSLPRAEQIESAFRKLDKLNWEFGKRVRDIYVTAIMSREVPHEEDDALPPPLDTGTQSIKRGCYLFGVAQYNDHQSQLKVDQELDKRMPLTDQAALRVHEAVYKAFRECNRYGEMDSTRARAVVGYLFSDRVLPGVLGNLPPAEIVVCRNDYYRFVVGIHLRSGRANLYPVVDHCPVFSPEPQEIKDPDFVRLLERFEEGPEGWDLTMRSPEAAIAEYDHYAPRLSFRYIEEYRDHFFASEEKRTLFFSATYHHLEFSKQRRQDFADWARSQPRSGFSKGWVIGRESDYTELRCKRLEAE